MCDKGGIDHGLRKRRDSPESGDFLLSAGAS